MSDDFWQDLSASFKKGWDSAGKPSISISSRPSFWSFMSWRDKEDEELRQLHHAVRKGYDGSIFGDNDLFNKVAYEIAMDVKAKVVQPLSMPLLEAIYEASFAILNTEFFMTVEEIEKDWEKKFDLQEADDIRILLKRRLSFLDNHNQAFIDACKKLVILFTGILKNLPALPPEDNGATRGLKFETPLLELADDPAQIMERTIVTLFDKDIVDPEIFHDTREQIIHNLKLASGFDPCRPSQNFDACKCKLPTEQKGKTAEQLCDSYLGNTPCMDFFKTPITMPVPEEARFEHIHILAGTGHGKTQALQHLIIADLQKPAQDVPAMVILDSQGDMLATLQRLALFDPSIANSLSERLLIVDPSDVEFAPSLNLFDIQSDRIKDYSQKDREQVLAGIIEIYDYIFSGLLGAELTQKQSMVFRFLAQLMLEIPGSTIHTLRDLLIDSAPYMEHVAKLPATARSFFETQFFGQGYRATREQILRRLYGVLQNPSFERMFASPQNRLDLFPVLNNGGIVLVNTAKDFMKGEASSIFGRYIIALTFKAAMERAILPEQQRRPTFLWIDEASEYFDDNIDSLLIQARKFRLGVVMAHQYLGQLPRGLPASIMTNTSIKLAGGTSDKDAREMSREMRTTPDFITAMTKEATATNFAAFVRNVTPQAMKLTIPFGTAENLPQMSDESFEVLRARSRERLSSVGLEDKFDETTPKETGIEDDVFWES